MATFNNSIPILMHLKNDDKDNRNDNNNGPPTFLRYDNNNHHRHPYDTNGKVMVTAIISLSVVVLLVLALHLFARYILRRQSHRHRRQPPIHRLTFSVTNPLPSPPAKTGLDAAAIAALPISAYRPTASTSPEGDDCAVCLGVLAEAEPVRLLPSCGHAFHVECVDTWLAAQSTCPVCRADVESPPPPPPPPPPEGPSAPPLSSSSPSDCGTDKVLSSNNAGGSSRLSSFRRILSRERSSIRVTQSSLGQDQEFVDDLERQ